MVVSGGIVVFAVSGGVVVVLVVSVVVVVVVGILVVAESTPALSLVSEALRVELHAEAAIINEPTTARLKIVFFIG